MTKQFRPMLAEAPDPKHPIRFPVLASPKLDGIRCVITPDGPRTRSLKPIPNVALRERLGDPSLIGLDGELIAGEPNAPDAMQRTSSAVMSHDGPCTDVTFWVFDRVVADFPFTARYPQRGDILPAWVKPLAQVVIHNDAQLNGYEAAAVAGGYEGVILRAPDAPYKFGRSTVREQGMLKLKRFVDMEGEVVGFYQQTHNANEQFRDERGFAKRSTKQDGLVPVDALGGVQVALGPEWTEPSVDVGNGWTAAQRAELWARRDTLVGRLCKFKYQPHGSKDKPRCPVFLGWRHPEDMS